MERSKLPWSQIWRLTDSTCELVFYDQAGLEWKRALNSKPWRVALAREQDGRRITWEPQDDDWLGIDPPAIPEPPDGTRFEFEHHTDVYAAWRDDASAAQAGFPVGEGGEVWCLYGTTVPRTWTMMWLEFGQSLALAVRLVPLAGDLARREQWPTAQFRRDSR